MLEHPIPRRIESLLVLESDGLTSKFLRQRQLYIECHAWNQESIEQTYAGCFKPEEGIGVMIIGRLEFYFEDCHSAAIRFHGNFRSRGERHHFLMKGSSEANQRPA